VKKKKDGAHTVRRSGGDRCRGEEKSGTLFLSLGGGPRGEYSWKRSSERMLWKGGKRGERPERKRRGGEISDDVKGR